MSNSKIIHQLARFYNFQEPGLNYWSWKISQLSFEKAGVLGGFTEGSIAPGVQQFSSGWSVFSLQRVVSHCIYKYFNSVNNHLTMRIGCWKYNITLVRILFFNLFFPLFPILGPVQIIHELGMQMSESLLIACWWPLGTRSSLYGPACTPHPQPVPIKPLIVLD